MKEKHKYGQYFTEKVIADYMVSLIEHRKDCRVLEPSCGKGVFIDSLYDQLFTNCTAYEIDSELATEYKCVQHRSFLSVSTAEKYDVVIGNPPYIRWKNIEEELKAELYGNEYWNRYFNSLCDYLFVFILKSIEHLAEGGELIFITSDYWMNSTHSLSLRNYMVANGYFDRIYHFKEAPLFEQVNASFVIFRYIKSRRQAAHAIRLLDYIGSGQPTPEALHQETCFDSKWIPQFETNSRWLLATAEEQEKVKMLEKACRKKDELFGGETWTIGDVCDIGNGMVSGLDKAFKLEKDEVARLNDQERVCTIRVLKAKSLQQYLHDDSSLYIYMPMGIAEEAFLQSYPLFASHLKPYREALEKRYSYGKELPYWEFAFPRSKTLFERDEAKVFVPCKERVSHKNYYRFCYAPSGYFPLQDVTAIVKKSTCRESIEYILAYLNSQQVYQWLRYNGVVKGEIVEFSEAPISGIPYRKIDWDNADEVYTHSMITSKVRDMIESGERIWQKEVNTLINKLMYGHHRLQESA